MPKLPGSGIRMASIPLAQTVQPFSPESGSTDPGPGPAPRPSGGSVGAAGLIGLLLLGIGLGGGLLTAPSDEQTVVPPAGNTVTVTAPALGPLEVPPALRVYLIP